jgi:sulfur carrier protein
MRLTVNGEYRTLPEQISVADLVGQLTGQCQGLAVAVNGDVVPRSAWGDNRLNDGDAVEVLTAVQGG